MYKQFLKSILLVTVATFSLSTLVSAKPIPKNATYNQIYDGLEAKAYKLDDLVAAAKKEQPNVLGFWAYLFYEGKKFDEAHTHAQKAIVKNDALGKFIVGNLYLDGYKHNSSREGSKLITQACVDGKLGQKFSKVTWIVKMCDTALGKD